MLSAIFAILFALLTLFAGLHLYGYYLSFYWTKKGVSSPKIRKNFIENQASFLFDPFSPGIFQLKKWSEEFGKFYGYLEGFRRVLVVSDPVLANEVMVKKFDVFHGRKLNPIVGDVVKDERVHVFNAKGTRWKRLRTIANPCFSVSNLKKILPVIEDSAEKLMPFLEEKCQRGEEFDIHPFFDEFTMDVICRIAMGQKGSRIFDNPIVELIRQVNFSFSNNLIEYVAHVFPALGPWIGWFILEVLGKITTMPMTVYFDLIMEKVQQRKAERAKMEKMEPSAEDESKMVDFIDLFLDAENTEIVDETFATTNLKVSKKMTTWEIVGQCFLFLVAGFDTTSTTLATAVFFLARNPEMQEKLIKEVDGIFADGADFSYENVNKMKYADCVMKETLRLCPLGAFAASRECQERTTLSNGIQLDPGDCVALDLYTLHYDKKIWGEDADEFNPERFMDFTPEMQMAYYPFGGGPRTCIAFRMAYLEGKLMLAKLFQKFRFKVSPKMVEQKMPKMIGNTILTPEKVDVILTNRLED